MSCVAESSATAAVSQRMGTISDAGANSPSAAMLASRPIWVISIQPRRLPSGGA